MPIRGSLATLATPNGNSEFQYKKGMVIIEEFSHISAISLLQVGPPNLLMLKGEGGVDPYDNPYIIPHIYPYA